MKFKKKPVVIDAVQWTGENFQEMMTLDGFNFSSAARYDFDECMLFIHTLEGDMRADVGDYIIRGVHGEFYPCNPDIFHETYEDAEAEDAEKELHVRYDIGGVYAGYTYQQGEDEFWVKNKRTDVTDEALAAVRDYLFMDRPSLTVSQYGRRWTLKDGRNVTLLLDISDPESDEAGDENEDA